MSNENDKKSSLEQLAIIIRGIADIIKAIGSSSQSLTTIAIAISFSVTLSTVTIMYVPQVQEAIRGPQGEPGQQGLKVEVYVLKYDTQTGYSPYPIYSTQFGGTDRKSDVYLHVTFRGQNVNATNLAGDVIDGGKYNWNGIIQLLETGIYRSRWDVVSGVAAGSYLVDINVIYTVGTGSDAVTYYGKAIYTIDCTATTT